ncbi:hypothetical protein [Neorickettsia findlayensis]|uniref:Transmembrane protein n=1 Tax=Neorickettsia findlayensis TaxID=2686014 RepID=A0A6P1GAG8_9RICK|nr:hypothetical protein [Neorickettsia findlayensis]QHD64921.1 hypothetical protein GP480_00315 [Neorickettsia findlayensis]
MSLVNGYQKVARVARVVTLSCVVVFCAIIFAVWMAKRVPWGDRPVTKSWFCLVYIHGVALCLVYALVLRSLFVMVERSVGIANAGGAEASSGRQGARTTERSLLPTVLKYLSTLFFLAFLVVVIVVDRRNDLSLVTKKVLAGVECSLLFFYLLLLVYHSFYAARDKKTVPAASPSASPSASLSASPSASLSASLSASPSASLSASPSASLSDSPSASPSGTVLSLAGAPVWVRVIAAVVLEVAPQLFENVSSSHRGGLVVDECNGNTTTNVFDFGCSDPFSRDRRVMARLGVRELENSNFTAVEVVLRVARGDPAAMRQWVVDSPSASLLGLEDTAQQAITEGSQCAEERRLSLG